MEIVAAVEQKVKGLIILTLLPVKALPLSHSPLSLLLSDTIKEMYSYLQGST